MPPNIAHLLGCFETVHLRDDLKPIVQPFHDLAQQLGSRVAAALEARARPRPQHAEDDTVMVTGLLLETATALQLLVQAKDAAVRARISGAKLDALITSTLVDGLK